MTTSGQGTTVRDAADPSSSVRCSFIYFHYFLAQRSGQAGGRSLSDSLAVVLAPLRPTGRQDAGGDLGRILNEQRSVAPHERQPDGNSEEVTRRIPPRARVNPQDLGRRSEDESHRVDGQARPGGTKEEDPQPDREHEHDEGQGVSPQH